MGSQIHLAESYCNVVFFKAVFIISIFFFFKYIYCILFNTLKGSNHNYAVWTVSSLFNEEQPGYHKWNCTTSTALSGEFGFLKRLSHRYTFHTAVCLAKMIVWYLVCLKGYFKSNNKYFSRHYDVNPSSKNYLSPELFSNMYSRDAQHWLTHLAFHLKLMSSQEHSPQHGSQNHIFNLPQSATWAHKIWVSQINN